MKQTGIIMSGNHPKLILDEIKTMTRRTYGLEKVNREPDAWEFKRINYGGVALFWRKKIIEEDIALCKCPYGQVGDRLIIKETWATEKQYDHLKPSEIPDTAKIFFINKLTHKAGGYSLFTEMGKVRSAMFMCKWMSRIPLEITEVRVERVQEITAYDALLEGIGLPIPKGCEIPAPPPEYESWSEEHRENWIKGQARATYFSRCADAQDHIDAFKVLWDSLNAKRGFGWEVNPWVWVISFKRIEEGGHTP